MTPVTPITRHQEPAAPAADSRSFNCEGTLAVVTLFKRWLIVVGRLETARSAEIREARDRNVLKVTL